MTTEELTQQPPTQPAVPVPQPAQQVAQQGPPQAEGAITTPQLIAAMLKGRDHVSDLVFSPGHAPQIEASGQLVELKFRGLEKLLPAHTQRIAQDLLGKSEYSIKELADKGSADVSYAVPQLARFRVNIFRQRGTIAIVM